MSTKNTKEKPETQSGNDFDEYLKKENRRFICRVCGWIVLFVIAAILSVLLFKTCNKMEGVDDKVKNLTDSSCQMKILIDSTAKDTIHFISKQDVQIMVNDAVDKKTSAYVDQQGNLLALHVGIMAFFALIVTIMVPLIMNNRQQDKIEKLIDKHEEKFENYYESIKSEGKNIVQKAEEIQSTKKQKLAETNRQLEELKNELNSSENQSEYNAGRQNVGRDKNIVVDGKQKNTTDNEQSVNLNGKRNDSGDAELVQNIEKTKEESAVKNAGRQVKLKSQMDSIIKEVQAQIAYDKDLERIWNIGDPDEKIYVLRKNIEEMPGNPLVRYCELSGLYAKKRAWKDAIIWVKSALSIDQEYVDAYIQLADVLQQRKDDSQSDLQEAWKYIEMALDINPGSLDALNLRSKILFHLGYYSAAKNAAHRVHDMALKETKIEIAKDAEYIIAYQEPKHIDDFELEIAGVKFAMKGIEGGAFTIGTTGDRRESDSDEHPAHKVLLSNYYIGETVVTQALWMAVMGDRPSRFKGGNRPVETVSWNEVTQKFIPELNRKTGLKFRLPTEAEWEYAARGGNKSKEFKYSGSNNIDEVAWYGGNSNSESHPVKSKKANELGLYDMSGNVYEWCQDRYGDYSDAPETNPTGPETGQERICRGGSWHSNESYCRVAQRIKNRLDYKNVNYGFRLALSPGLPQEEKKEA